MVSVFMSIPQYSTTLLISCNTKYNWWKAVKKDNLQYGTLLKFLAPPLRTANLFYYLLVGVQLCMDNSVTLCLYLCFKQVLKMCLKVVLILPIGLFFYLVIYSTLIMKKDTICSSPFHCPISAYGTNRSYSKK